MMGSTFTFVSIIITISLNENLGYSAALGALVIGGLIEGFLGPYLVKLLHRFLTPIVTGTVVLAIGISILGYGVNYSAGGSAADYGSGINWLIAIFVLVIAIALNVFCKGFVSSAAVFIAMVAGFILAAILGIVDFSQIGQAGWVSFPQPLHWGLSFKMEAIIPVLILYLVSMLEFVGDTTGTCYNAAGRTPTETELARGIRCDGLGSAFSAIFNAAPNVSFSQNVGLIAITGVKSRYVVGIGGIILLCMSFFPKLAMLLTIMPQSVLGGACIMMFGMIAVSGIQVITKEVKITPRNALILAVALGVGMGNYMDTTALANAPSIVSTLLTGIPGTALTALILNIILPGRDSVGDESTVKEPGESV